MTLSRRKSFGRFPRSVEMITHRPVIGSLRNSGKAILLEDVLGHPRRASNRETLHCTPSGVLVKMFRSRSSHLMAKGILVQSHDRRPPRAIIKLPLPQTGKGRSPTTRFFSLLEKLSSSRRLRRAARCTARNINCENIGMVPALTPPLRTQSPQRPERVPWLLQKNYGSHGIFVYTAPEADLCVKSFSRPRGSNPPASARQSRPAPDRSGAAALGEWCFRLRRAPASPCETPGRRWRCADPRPFPWSADRAQSQCRSSIRVLVHRR